MIPFQLGFRNLIGILVPGAVLALVIFTCLDILFPGMGQAIARETSTNTGPLVVTFLLTAYILGSVIRLWSADTVDQLSASRVKIRLDPFKDTKGGIEDHLGNLLRAVRAIEPGISEPPIAPSLDNAEPSDSADKEYFEQLLKYAQNFASRSGQKQEVNRSQDAEPDLIRWAWKYDEFPYPAWEIMKLRLYHPNEVFNSFKPYMRCFATGYRRNKEFFNYCKAVIYGAYQGKRHALAEEVQSMEAYVRFFGGVFWALLLSALALVLTAMYLLLFVVQRSTTGSRYWLTAGLLLLVLILSARATWVVWKAVKFVRQEDKVSEFWTLSKIAAGSLVSSAVIGASRPELATAARMNFVALAMLVIAFLIIAGGRFRLSRLKEVDTVFDAFSLVQPYYTSVLTGGSELAFDPEAHEKS